MSKATVNKSTKKATTTASGKRRQPPRKFETLVVSDSTPVVISEKVGKCKLHFVV